MRTIMLVGAMIAAAGAAVAWIGPMERPIAMRSTGKAGSAGTAPPVLVELFTSQGCSSCPPADKLLARLDAGGGVVALSRPVTYWDRLGWKDTLARAQHDDLQRRYAARGLPGSGVYTPETVVQGANAAVGSDERGVRSLIAAARTRNPVMLVQSGERVIASRAVPGVELHFVAVARNRPVKIVRGENGGRAIGYTNVVLNEAAATCSSSAPCNAAIPPAIAGAKGADRWAAVLQDKGSGRVRAVRWISRATK
ncbi:DUF1223 domain-containing protein [Sphingopyxis panaciterrae]